MNGEDDRMTLTEFLLTRIDEDEEVARDAAGWDRTGSVRASGRWVRSGISSVEDDQREPVIYGDDGLTGSVADHVARFDPARVLAECEAKRRIVKAAEAAMWDSDDSMFPDPLARDVLASLAAVYADHPDYRDEWRSGGSPILARDAQRQV